MSRLKLYWPEETAERFSPAVSEPRNDHDVEVLPFRGREARPRMATPMLETLMRAHQLRKNRHCPCCSHPVVEPIELNDGAVNRSGLPIPGTATLVGFRCDSCSHEWPV